METVRTRTIFSDRKYTVTALESLEYQADKSREIDVLIGSLKPIAVIVTGPDRTYAVDMDGRPVDIDQLELPDDCEL